MQEKLFLFLYTFMILFLMGCKHDEFDGKFAAKQYCNCLQVERNSGKDFFESRAKCDGELLINNRYFRLDYVGLSYGSYIQLLSDKLKDSLAKFHFDFYDYIAKNCCKNGLKGCDKNDSLQIKMNAIDTSYRRR